MSQFPQVLISAKEAAAILHEDPRSVQRKAKAGTLPFVTKMPGAKGAYIFDMAQIQQIVRERRAASSERVSDRRPSPPEPVAALREAS